MAASYPHDPSAFTQGLQWCDGTLYESTGGVGTSRLRVVELSTGEPIREVTLPDEYFGEGIAVVGDHLWQLTWKHGLAFRRDRESLAETERVGYLGVGWGLCYDRAHHRLIMSEGSSRLLVRDPDTFEQRSTIEVHGHSTANGFPLMLNDLAVAGGLVWANVYPTDEIVAIDPETGLIVLSADASPLHLDQEMARVDVLNGITTVPGGDRFLLTGKLWSRVYEVRFVPVDDGPPPKQAGR